MSKNVEYYPFHISKIFKKNYTGKISYIISYKHTIFTYVQHEHQHTKSKPGEQLLPSADKRNSMEP